MKNKMFKFCVILLMIHVYGTCSHTLLQKVSYGTVAETLKTYHRSACDGDILSMDCPEETQISIQRVLYGISSPSDSICPKDILQHEKFAGNSGSNCDIGEAHRSVEELCGKKQNCSILTSPTLIGVSLYDPCPGVRKHIKVEYICDPFTFMTTVICKGKQQTIECESHAKIAILSSFFISAELDTMFCPLRTEIKPENVDSTEMTSEGNMRECERSEVTHAISRDCHGHNRCRIAAKPSQLGANDCNSKHVLLNITFACISSENFNPDYLRHIYLKDMQKTEHRTIEQISENENSMFGSNEMDEETNFEKEKTVQYKDSKHPSLKEDENLPILIGYESHSTNSSNISEEIINVATLNNINMDLSPGEFDNEAEFHINLTAKTSSPQNKIRNGNASHLPSTPLLNMLYKFVAGINDIVQVIKKKSSKLMIVIFLSVGLPLSCFLILFIIRIYQLCRSEEENDIVSETSSHWDSDLL